MLEDADVAPFKYGQLWSEADDLDEGLPSH